MHAHKRHVLIKLDITNAFDSVWRKAVLKACYNNPRLRHLCRLFWCALSTKAKIVGIGRLSEEGMQQGDPAGPVGCCISSKGHLLWAHEQLQAVGGCVVMDIYGRQILLWVDQDTHRGRPGISAKARASCSYSYKAEPSEVWDVCGITGSSDKQSQII